MAGRFFYQKKRRCHLSVYLHEKEKQPPSRGRLLQSLYRDPRGLIVLGLELEVSLRMITYGTYLGSLLAYADVATVAALPDAVALA